MEKSESPRSTAEIVDEYYRCFYERVHGGGGPGLIESLMHKSLERKSRVPHRMLEIGVGNFEHLPYLKSEPSLYVAIDLRSPSDEMLRINRFEKAKAEDVKGLTTGRYFVQVSIEEFCSLDVGLFDRIVASCVLLHLDEPDVVMTLLLRILEEESSEMRLLLPTEPSWIINLWRMLVSRRRAQALGFNHFDLVNAADHKNYSRRVAVFAGHVFADENWRIRGVPISSPFDIATPYSILEVDR